MIQVWKLAESAQAGVESTETNGRLTKSRNNIGTALPYGREI